jgi:polyisoprenoid-binding protein YceI
MLKKVLIGIVILLVAGGITVAAYVLRPTSEASAPIEAIPVEVEDSEPETALDAESANEGESIDVQEVDEMPVDVEVENEDQPGNMVIFSIVQQDSEARFTLNELLRGAPTTVVGATNQVAGEIAVDFDNPTNSQAGTILVNARTLVTDNDFRNRAINNKILETQKYEFITFTPTSISGFPENPQFGDELVFQMIGDLTIRDITREVIFDASITVESETQLSGFATTIIAREDYELTIPSVPSVADVDEEVLLEIEFLAASK